MNSLFVLKLLIETGEYSLVTLIEAYFLKEITSIVKFRFESGHKNDKEAGMDYLMMKGFKNDRADFAKISTSLVVLAGEILHLGKIVKPK